MAPLPKNPAVDVNHFIHPGHALAENDDTQDYLCDGCKTSGTGKRYRCRVGCDFDMHEFCATGPRYLSTFMHKHQLSLVMRKDQNQRQNHRVCDVCADPVEGLFYRCQICDFDVHTLCTQLPRELRHALHPTHPLNLESNHEPRFCCAVCKNACSGWRYRCAICNFDIHMECVLAPVVRCPELERQQSSGPYGQKIPETKQRRVSSMFEQGVRPYRPPPQFASYYPSHGVPYYNINPAANYYNFRPDLNMYYNQHVMHPANFVPQYHHPQQVGAGAPASGSSHGTGNAKPGKSMFSLVGQLGFGVLSNMIFGVDLVSLFAA